MNSLTISQIPTIDLMDENLKPGTETWISASQVVRSALEANGCFYVMSNKISTDLHNSVISLMEELFDLPLETKKQETSNKPYHGYLEPTAKFPLYESVGIDFAGPYNKEAIQKYANIMWPTGYHHFCETINLYAKLLVEIDQTARRLLFDAYGLDKRHCDSLIESTNYMLRSFKYLVKLRSGEWIDVDPSPCLFLVGAGDALKFWSNDRILACEHKVVIKEKKKRCSMGLFSFNKSMLQTQEELVDEDHPKRYKSVNHYEYVIFLEKFPSQVFSFLQV